MASVFAGGNLQNDGTGRTADADWPPKRSLHVDGCLPVMLVGLALDGVGQMLGYAFGVGNAVEEVAKVEAHRARHITERDRLDLFEQVERRPA